MAIRNLKRRWVSLGWLALWAFALGSAQSCGHTYNTYFDLAGADSSELKQVAVLPLENLTETPEAGDAATAILVTELRALGKFQVIGKTQMQQAFQEKNIRLPAMIDRVMAMEIGRRLGVDAVMIGSVSEYLYRADKETDEMEPAVGINLRLVSTRTGTVIWGASQARSSYELFSYQKDPLSRVATMAIREMVGPLKGL